jgi:hypothetical protein
MTEPATIPWQQAPFDDILKYWRSLLGDNKTMPAWQDFDVLRLGKHMASLELFELRDGKLTSRLAGDAIIRDTSRNVMQREVGSFLSGEQKQRMMVGARYIILNNCVGFGIGYRHYEGDISVEFSMITAPFSGTEPGHFYFVAGALVGDASTFVPDDAGLLSASHGDYFFIDGDGQILKHEKAA